MRLIMVLTIGSIVMTTWSKINIVKWFEIDSSKGAFSHMEIDRINNYIYIGAINNLYHLSSDLMLVRTAKTGPKDDSPNCQPLNNSSSCNQPKIPMDAYNKALVIYSKTDTLIACSSLYHGICERYSLNDFKPIEPDTYVPVVANDATSTTVAFIAQGPPNDISRSDVLYVAASRTNAGQSAFRDSVPAIASRKLETFELVYTGKHQSSSKNIEATFRYTFPVYYIYGFSSDNFSYFVTVQKQNPMSESYISKLIRVCQKDKNYYSYAEVQLKCMHGGTFYNLVQAAYVGSSGKRLATSMGISEHERVLYVVSSIGKPNTAIPGNYSALCVYPLRTVRRTFTENIQACFHGTGNTGPSHIISPAPCKRTNFTIKNDYCGTYDINTPIDGMTPIQTDAAITFNTTVSAVAVSWEDQDTIAFVGTVNGHIIKVLINSTQTATSYEDITIEDGTKINADLIFGSYRRHLYVLTDRRVYKLELEECKHYKTWSDCTLGGHCCWCQSKYQCFQENECETNQHCGDYSFVIEIAMGRQDTIKLDQLPKLQLPNQQMHECEFRYKYGSIMTKGNITSDGTRTCETPHSSLLRTMDTEEDQIWMDLLYSINGKVSFYSRVTLYDCSLQNSCTRCTESKFACTWCIEKQVCTSDMSDCPTNTTIRRNSTQYSFRYCPRISSSETEIFVPSETNKKIVVSALDLKDFQTSFTCWFNLDNSKQVSANLTRLSNGVSIIECEHIHFTYVGNSEKMNVPFHIFWAFNKSLDKPDNMQVIMYKCEKMADSCGKCLSLTNQYECGWCDGNCTIQSRCSSIWLSPSETCPNPEIINIEPNSGPMAGGTNITITGINLGNRFEDISGVYIENSTRVQCKPLKDRYIAFVRIVCVSGASPFTGATKLVVTIINKYNATASHKFAYVNPVLVDIKPIRGPKSGGTLVTLSGNDMNTGNTRTVWIGNHCCKIESFNRTKLTCLTCMASDTMEKYLNVQFDNQMVTSNITYDYTPDPTIINIDPKVAIASGGIKIDVTGTQLDTIQEPKMVWNGDTKIEVKCEVVNEALMHCYSPQVKSRNRKCSNNSDMKELYSYGFILDNVQDVLNLTKKNKDKFKTFSIVTDPIFQPLTRNVDNTYQYKPNSDLIINATCLNGVKERDVTVQIGKGFCSEIAVGEFQITCKPPKDQPTSLKESASPEIIVNIGHEFSAVVGYLRYDQQAVPESNYAIVYLVIGLILGIVLLVIIIVVVILVLKKREKNMRKTWQTQLDKLESKVAKECNEDNTHTSGSSAPVIDKSTVSVLKDAKLIINRNRLRLGDSIGQGHYGCVIKGYLTLPGDKGDNIVAIKTLHKKNLRDIDLDAFLREILIMKEFHHPNVLRLLGICFGRNEIPMMVLPFMEHGDLLSYIRDDTNTPAVEDLIHFGIGIAEGMAYLSDHKFVHRDLAARNCMLDDKLNVKVADFGLSREIYEKEYYSSDSKKTKLPIRWMAPESMEKGTYSSKSDVWSYGVVLWELMTKGVTPYPEVDNWDILQYLQKGRRLLQPQYCPDKVYAIMQKCWLVDPYARPTFSVLAREITDMMSVVEHDMQQGVMKIEIHCAQFNKADSAKHNYAYDDTYLEPPTKTEPKGSANSGTDYMEVFDDTNDVQIDAGDDAYGKNKNEPYHYAYHNTYLETTTKIEPKGDNSRNDYIEILDDNNDVQIDPAGGANGNNKNDSYLYAYDDSSMEQPTKSEPVEGATGNYMEEYDGTNDVQCLPPSGANSNNKHETCHGERLSIDVDAPGKLTENT